MTRSAFLQWLVQYKLNHDGLMRLAIQTGFASLTLALTAFAAADRPPADVYTPAAMDLQRFAGPFSERMRANIEGFLEHIDQSALLAPFEHRATTPSESPVGESAGLFLIAAANSYDYSDDVQLKRVMDGVARRLLHSQEKDGYIGIYVQDQRWGPGDMLSYAGNLLGLLAYAHVTGNDDATAAVHRACDLLINTFSASTFSMKRKSPPDAAAVVPAMAEMYEITGDYRYLNFAKGIASMFSGTPHGNVLESVLGAYGQVEYYRLNGDASSLRSAGSVWKDVAASPDSVDHIPATAGRIDGCVSLSWLQLTLELFRATGDARYAAEFENIAYNALFPAEDPRNGDIDASVPLDGGKTFSNRPNVCSVAVSAGISSLGNLVWGRYANGIAILSYNPGRATIRLSRRATIQLYSESEYPSAGNVVLHVEPSHDVTFPLRLMVPGWTHNFTVDVAGSHLVGTPGQLLVIGREWKRGDTLRINMELSAATVALPSKSGAVVIRRGPELLSSQHQTDASVTPSTIGQLKDDVSGPMMSSSMPATAMRFSLDGVTLVPFADTTAAQALFKQQ